MKSSFVRLVPLLLAVPLASMADISHRLVLPPGFSASVYARVPDARSMTMADDGTVFVSTRRLGRIYALRDTNNDGRADQRFIVASGLTMPNGISWYRNHLYVAETHRIIRYNNITRALDKPASPVVIFNRLPTASHHGWRYMATGPDKRLTVAVGAPCNVCLIPNTALIYSMKHDGSDLKVIARGVRNSVGFDWHPLSGRLWFSDNGRDWLGDDLPRDEINRLDRPGQHFGFPWCHGNNTADPVFGKRKSCSSFTPPAAALQAHTAPLGIRFYTGQMFPARYRHQLFVAQHGSWNRSRKVGYRVLVLDIKNGKVINKQIFISGWLRNEKVYGRPVDLLVLKDGSMLVSDDYNGVIYRISYRR